MANNVVFLENEMESSYLDYAMSVIVSRALPDHRDGLKPVHRRIFYAMHDTGNRHDKPYRKSARVVGEVMGKYHPHGDSPIYSSLARMAQDFSLLVPLIDGQGNFGSIDGDEPAQMRYTEVRLAKIADEGILSDLGFDTVDFQDNYDNSTQEPKVLPARFPNLLVNGAHGIAVGMATNIPTHNIDEVIDGCCAYLDNENISAEEMLKYIPGPDFPTGGEIVGHDRLRNAMLNGRGSITIRGKASVERVKGHKAIIITEIPYQVNKAELVKTIEGLAKNKIIEGISEIRDESNKLGIRVVIEVKKDFEEEIILNRLYKNTQLETSFGFNMLALKDRKPLIMNFHDIISSFIKFREEIVTRRTRFLLARVRARAHVLAGLLIAIDNIDEVVKLIRSSNSPSEAKIQLTTMRWNLSGISKLITTIDSSKSNTVDSEGCVKLTEEQAQSILDMKLQRLTGLESEKIVTELNKLSQDIAEYVSILNSRNKLLSLIKKELLELRQSLPRRTSIIQSSKEFIDEDFIQKEDVVVTITNNGYIKRTQLESYREQKRGGRGKAAMSIYEDDILTDVIVTNTHSELLFFSDIGKVYRLKVYKLPASSPQGKGRALVNILNLSNNEKITRVLEVSSFEDDYFIIFASSNGNIRRNSLSDFNNIPSNGKIAIKLDEDDRLIGVVLCKCDDHLFLATKQGKAIRFSVSDLRIFKSRSSDGVRGVRLSREDDKVVSLATLRGIELDYEKREFYLKIPLSKRLEIKQEDSFDKAILIAADIDSQSEVLSNEELINLAKNEEFLLTITSKGYGKCTSAYDYRVTSRGGKGVANIEITEKNGYVISTFPVQYEDSILALTDSGVIIRLLVNEIRVTGRSAIGVKIINLQEGDYVGSVSKVE